MKMNWKRVQASVAVVAAAVVVGVSVAPKPASAEGLDEIRKRGKVVVGTEAAYYPFEFIENGNLAPLESFIDAMSARQSA